jgi:hypothetical protein
MRKFVIRSFGLDDWMVIPALIMVTGFASLSITITYYGLGRRQATVSAADLAVFMEASSPYHTIVLLLY